MPCSKTLSSASARSSTRQHDPMELNRRSFLLGAAAALTMGCSAQEAASPDDANIGPTPATSSTAAPTPTPFPTVGESSPASLALSDFVDRGPGTAAGVALTFHVDGPAVLASELLDLLAAREAPVTAFLIGSWVEANPDLARRIRDEGHEVANHTFGHVDMSPLTEQEVADEYSRCAEVLDTIVGDRGRWARPSQIDVPTQTMRQGAALAGYPTSVGFNRDPLDYKDPGVQAVVDATLDGLALGDIVSLHFGHPDTNAAMPAILDGMEQLAIKPVTVSDLLAV